MVKMNLTSNSIYQNYAPIKIITQFCIKENYIKKYELEENYFITEKGKEFIEETELKELPKCSGFVCREDWIVMDFLKEVEGLD